MKSRAAPMYQLASLFLLLSGIAALTYQVTWVRLLGLSMGSTSASISTVLAAFFLGMALGSYAADKLTRNRIDSLTPYILLEAVIAVSGLILLPALLHLDALLAWLPAIGTALAFKFAVAMALLSVPTVAMGATFPVMAAILIRRRDEVGLRIGQLYGLNTAGAVLGAALCGFVFIPRFGLDGAIFIAVFLNTTIAIVAMMLNRRISLPPLQATTPVPVSGDTGAPAGLALTVLFFTGFASIATEVGWTKYLAIFTGTTIYGFAAILAIFLTGIAVGSWAMKSAIERMRHPRFWLGWGLLATAMLLLLTRAGLAVVPALYEGINHMGIPGAVRQGVKYAVVLLLLFPPTFFFGALFPLNLKLYCGDLGGVRHRVGKAYAVNTVAGIAGSILAGFWIIPHYGTDTLLSATALTLLALLPLFVATIDRPVRRAALAAAAAIALAGNWALPHIDYRDLIASVDYSFDGDATAGAEPEFLYLGEGKSSVVSLVTYDGKIAKVQANGLNESLIDMHDANNALIIESLLAYMPYFLHPDPKSAFVVGFGGGTTTRAFTQTGVESIHVVELEPKVVEADRALKNGPITALEDPRVQLDFNDARNTLLVEPRTYDLIAAQPSHPWLAGVANVFTEEFFAIVKSRLNEDGIYSQWVNLFRMDVSTLRAITKAFYDVFPYGMGMANLDTGDFMLIGAKKPLRFDYDRIEERMQRPGIKDTLAKHKVMRPIDLLWYFSLSRQDMITATRGSVANRDTNIFSEVRLSGLTDDPTGEEDPYDFLRNIYHFDVGGYFDVDEAPQRLFEAGLRFLDWDSPKTAAKIATELDGIDPVLARDLHHALLAWRADDDAAGQWYAKYDQWPDRTHLRQARLFLDAGNFAAAEDAVARIADRQLRRTGLAQILYRRSDWAALAALEPKSDPERIWQLIGLAHTDLADAGAELAKLVDDKSEEIAPLRVLVEYYAAIGNTVVMDKRARQLVRVLDQRATHLVKLATAALDDDEQDRARRLIGKIEKLDPDAKELEQLQKRLAGLAATPA